VKKQRQTQRKSRERSGTFRVSLVGYTKAGSRRCSTRSSGRHLRRQPAVRHPHTTTARCTAAVEASVFAVDTVVHRDLPTSWSRPAAPRCRSATPTSAARDRLRRPLTAEQRDEVERVLHEIAPTRWPQVLVSTSSTASTSAQRPKADDGSRRARRSHARVFVSALTADGADACARAIADALIASQNARRKTSSAMPVQPARLRRQ